MKTKITFKSLLVISCLFLQLNLQAQIPPITLNVETAGTLSSLLGTKANQIADLTLTGKLNGSDIKTIRGMANLSILNIRDANIVNGGQSYYSYSNTDYKTSNNVIGDYMFCNMKNLTSVILSNSAASIKDYVFSGSSALISITIESNISLIEKHSFSDCTGLKELIVSEGNSNFATIDGVLCNKDKTTLIHYPMAKTTSAYPIPNTIISIGDYAFENCINLTSLTIGNNANSIGNSAFSGCNKLTSLTIGNNVTSIGEWAFYACYGLQSLTVPNDVISIGNYAFYACSGLTFFTIPNSVTSIGEGVFGSCWGLKSVTIPNSVISIGRSAFSFCTGLKSLTIPNSVISIGDRGFSGCNGLTSLTIPNSVTSIGEGGFADCTGLKSVTIPNSMTSIRERVFSGCNGLASVTIPNSVTSIEIYAFAGCIGLTSVTIGNSVTSFGNSVFDNCIGLKEIHCKNPTPVSVQSSTFNKVDKKTCNLYVPKGSYAAYWIALVWGDFANIIEENATTIVPINKDRVSINIIPNGIAIETNEVKSVSIFSISGQKAYQSTINGSTEINLNKGVYIVKVNNKSKKVIVR